MAKLSEWRQFPKNEKGEKSGHLGAELPFPKKLEGVGRLDTILEASESHDHKQVDNFPNNWRAG